MRRIARRMRSGARSTRKNVGVRRRAKMNKCSDCKRTFGTGYHSNVVDERCHQCDVFPWCWDCDEKHTIEEIKEGGEDG